MLSWSPATFLPRYTIHREAGKKLTELHLFPGDVLHFLASRTNTPGAFSSVWNFHPSLIIPCVRIAHEFLVSGMRDLRENTRAKRERKEESFHPSRITADRTSACCVAPPYAPRYACALTRVATRRGSKRSGVASEILRETYLHFNKRYYWMLRRGTTPLPPPDICIRFILYTGERKRTDVDAN